MRRDATRPTNRDRPQRAMNNQPPSNEICAKRNSKERFNAVTYSTPQEHSVFFGFVVSYGDVKGYGA
ncbi:unnamed protein product [Ceratitis capitata]|uniref:(Mediterranean fruit fly) hypothetical protein n=1 Tax=Ceratitis capitata TaxID=7213 RepID=A0A811UXK8_CERCA|nr:unnamed protein product [Ceratitis capitata]